LRLLNLRLLSEAIRDERIVVTGTSEWSSKSG
jgi:hypothetical protein